jgi:hypothetical protein
MLLKKLNTQSLILFLLLQIQTQKRKTTNPAAFTLLQLSSLPLLYILCSFSPPLPPLNALAELQHVLDFFHARESVYLVSTFKHCSRCQVLVTPMQQH